MTSEARVRSNPWAAESVLTLRDLIAALRRRWWWPVGFAVLAAAAAAYNAVSKPPLYRATVVVVPAGVEKRLGSDRPVLSQIEDLTSGDSVTEEALAVLQSREFGEKFIADHKLEQRLLPKEPRPTLAKAFRYFDRKVRGVTRDKKSGLITVYVDWTDREEAAAWANELVARVNSDMRSRAVASSTASLAYLEKERERSPYVETKLTIDRLVESQISRRMLATVTPEYVFRVVDRALPPDPDFPLGPSKAFLLVIGTVAGLMAGCGLAWLLAGFAGEFHARPAAERRI